MKDIHSLNMEIAGIFTTLLVKLDGNKIIASVQFRVKGAFCNLTRLFVVESHRKKGHAKSLLHYAETIAKQHSCVAAYVSVEQRALSGLKSFYPKHGYVPAFAFDDGEVVFSKPL